MENKHIMIIGAGLLQLPAIQAAKDMGLSTIVTDYNKEAIGLKIADYPIVMSTRDVEGSVRVARTFNERIKIDGVLTVGTDASVTVAAISGALGLIGNKFESAIAATNKLKMRERFVAMGIAAPLFASCWVVDDAYKAFYRIKPPLVVKPTSNMGARGVMLVDKEENLESAFNFAKANSPSGEVLLEEYIEGDELSIDAIIYKKNIYIAGVADRIIQYSPYFVETGHILPSSKPTHVIDDATRVMKDGIRALGLENGAAKGDIKITKNKGAVIIELAARLSGGFMSAYTYPYATGVNLIKSVILIAIGEEPEGLSPIRSKFSMERAIIPKPGIVTSISGVDKATEIKGIKNIFVDVQEGDVINKPTNNVEKAGHIIAVGDSKEELVAIVNKALDAITISTEKEGNITFNEIKTNALKHFNKTCFVCKVCDGKECKGEVPGMGGIGSGSSFFNNLKALKRYQIIPTYLHDVQNPDMRTSLFTTNISSPILVAPVTGTKTNMGGGLEEIDFMHAITKGAKLAGSIGMVGDGASSSKYLLGLEAIKEAGGRGIAIFKPRTKQDDIIKRIKDAEESGAIAVGVDVDAASFITMKLKNQAVETKNIYKLKELVKATHLPFVIKGIMSKTDALRALDTGAQCIIVSNHGGRVMDYMPGSMDVLASIVDAVGKDMIVMADGGFRTGEDVFKGLALGARFICIGRPVAIGAYGGRDRGVKFVLDKYKEELKKTMGLTGATSIRDIHRGMISMTPFYPSSRY